MIPKDLNGYPSVKPSDYVGIENKVVGFDFDKAFQLKVTEIRNKEKEKEHKNDFFSNFEKEKRKLGVF